MSNSVKITLFFVLLNMSLILGGFYLYERQGLLFGFILALGINALLIFFGENRLIQELEAVPLEGRDPWDLNNIVRKYAQRAGTPYPRLLILPLPQYNSFALGRSWTQACLCISSGLLDHFSKAEIEAVVALEMAHIKNLDTFWVGVVSMTAHSLMGLAHRLDQLWIPKRWIKKETLRAPFSFLIGKLVWFTMRIAVRKSAFYKNDAMAAQWLEKPDLLAQTLWKLESLSIAHPLNVPECTDHLFVVPPSPASRRYVRHPKAELRIRRLLGYFPV